MDTVAAERGRSRDTSRSPNPSNNDNNNDHHRTHHQQSHQSKPTFLSRKAVLAFILLCLYWFSSIHFQPLIQSLTEPQDGSKVEAGISEFEATSSDFKVAASASSSLPSPSNGQQGDSGSDRSWTSLLTDEQQRELAEKQQHLLNLAQNQQQTIANLTRIAAKDMGCCGGPPTQRGGFLDKCKQTCFTARVCQEEEKAGVRGGAGPQQLFPFSSFEQKVELRPALRLQPEVGKFKQWCQDEMSTSGPTATWCSPNDDTQNNQPQGNHTIPKSSSSTFFVEQTMKHITTGCSLFSMGGQSGPFDRMILFPDAKLAFCGIPKVGITQWIKFLRYTIGALDYQSLPHFKLDVAPLFFDVLPREKQLEILQDPTWTRAVFLRDPAERVLSAYLDKVHGKGSDRQKGLLGEAVTSFADFVQTLYTRPDPKCSNTSGPSWCWDPHWRPQFYSCGLHGLLPHFDFVGIMDSRHAANHTRLLLERVGLWESFGQSYGTSLHPESHKHRLCAVLPPDFNDTDVMRGFQQDLRAKDDRHTRHAKSKLDLHYNQTTTRTNHTRTLQIVQEMYAEDFALWNALTQQRPPLETKDTTRTWLTGQELAERLNPHKCRRHSRPGVEHESAVWHH